MSLVLTNATIATLSPSAVWTANVQISDGKIERLGTEAPPEGATVVNCSGRIIMPGNVCSHTHLYSTLARGMPPPSHQPSSFREILESVWWRLDRALDERSIRLSALVGILDAVRSGTTTLVDHHASPNCIGGSLDLLADAFDEVGSRGVLCYEVTDRGGKSKRDAGLRENDRFMRGDRRLTKGVIGAHASFTLDDDSLADLSSLSTQHKTGVHIHVAEDRCDEDDSLRRSGTRTAYRLGNSGLLQFGSIAAHGVHLDEGEVEEIGSSGAWLVHNCRSNLNNSVGRAPVRLFGDITALGTDGIDGDMFGETRTAFLRAREDSLDTTAERFADLLAGGGEMVSGIFHTPIGRLEAGSAADLIVLKYDSPTPLTSENLAWHWMFALTPGNVESVMIDGNWVLRQGEFCQVDEEMILVESKHEARRLWDRMEKLRY